jgi:hypothetical protein
MKCTFDVYCGLVTESTLRHKPTLHCVVLRLLQRLLEGLEILFISIGIITIISVTSFEDFW